MFRSIGSPDRSQLPSSGPLDRSRSSGFTLLEILVAFLIVALTFGALFKVFSTGLRGTTAAEEYTVAVLLAKSKLASFEIDASLNEGEQAGSFENGFRWLSTVRAYGGNGQFDDAASPLSAYEVIVTVSWGEPDDERAVTLTTLRLRSRE